MAIDTCRVIDVFIQHHKLVPAALLFAGTHCFLSADDADVILPNDRVRPFRLCRVGRIKLRSLRETRAGEVIQVKQEELDIIHPRRKHSRELQPAKRSLIRKQVLRRLRRSERRIHVQAERDTTCMNKQPAHTCKDQKWQREVEELSCIYGRICHILKEMPPDIRKKVISQGLTEHHRTRLETHMRMSLGSTPSACSVSKTATSSMGSVEINSLLDWSAVASEWPHVYVYGQRRRCTVKARLCMGRNLCLIVQGKERRDILPCIEEAIILRRVKHAFRKCIAHVDSCGDQLPYEIETVLAEHSLHTSSTKQDSACSRIRFAAELRISGIEHPKFYSQTPFSPNVRSTIEALRSLHEIQGSRTLSEVSYAEADKRLSLINDLILSQRCGGSRCYELYKRNLESKKERFLKFHFPIEGLPFKTFDQRGHDGNFTSLPVMVFSCVRRWMNLDPSHHLAVRNKVVFCWKCGAYSSQRVHGLAKVCPQDWTTYGFQHLRRLMTGLHPCHTKNWSDAV